MKERLIVIGLASLLAISIVLQLVNFKPSSSDSSVALSPLTKQGIGYLSIQGPVSFTTSSPFIPSSADMILSQIKAFKEDSNVKGLFIRINSPGGTSAAAQEIYEAVLDYKASTQRPVVASIQDVGASGAYYIAMAADTIFANPGSLVGSIGVFIGNINIADFAKKHGIDFTIYKSGPYKDTLSMWRDPSTEESVKLQELVDNVYAQFLEAFIEARSMDRSKAKALANGSIYTGNQALANGLIDRIGTGDKALSYIGEKTQLGATPTLILKSKKSMFDFFHQWTEQLNFTLFETQFQPALQLK